MSSAATETPDQAPTDTADQRPLAEVIRANILAEIARQGENPADFVQRALGISRVAAYRRIGASRRNDKRALTADERLAFSLPNIDAIADALGISTDLLTARDPLHQG
jgi:hypothetical protein